MKILLRPHHLLCLQGYRGQNYSRKIAASWNRVSEMLKQKPDTDVVIINGNDDLCSKCPAVLNKDSAKCSDQRVEHLDNVIKNLLNINNNVIYNYNDLIKSLKMIMTSKKHEELCSECAWWKKGLCKDSFK